MSPTVPVLASCVALLLAPGDARPPAQPAVGFRFHHLNVRVEDPGTALDEVAGRLSGTKTILQGHGAGVRVNGEYVILDRDAPERADPADSVTVAPDRDPSSIYLEARQWLSGSGGSVVPSELRETAVIPGLPDARVSAVAFVAADLASAVTTLAKRGASPVAHSDEGARYRLPSGLVVEVIAETEGAEAFWCPMHPGVRSPRETRCPVCGMALVPIPPPRIGEYKLDVSVKPGPRGRGMRAVRLVVRDPDTGEPVRAFVDVHERPFHLFVISRDLQRFAHVHPKLTEAGAFEVTEAFEEGSYLLVADFLPAGGTPQMLLRAVVTPGYAGSVFASPPLKAGPAEQTVDGLQVRLVSARVTALKPARLTFTVSHASGGAAVTDLEPYLGAPAHLLVVNPDLTVAIHGHPEGPASSGPDVVFELVLPFPGVYKLWLQVQRTGRIVTVPFVLEAR
jgi:hypothetical protein